jgi:hypothetical protein
LPAAFSAAATSASNLPSGHPKRRSLASCTRPHPLPVASITSSQSPSGACDVRVQ